MEVGSGDERSRPSFESLCFETRTALDRLAATAASYETTCHISQYSADNVPLFVLHSMYQAASFLTTLARAQPDEQTTSKIEVIKSLLGLLNKRWHLAGELFKIIAFFITV